MDALREGLLIVIVLGIVLLVAAINDSDKEDEYIQYCEDHGGHIVKEGHSFESSSSKYGKIKSLCVDANGRILD